MLKNHCAKVLYSPIIAYYKESLSITHVNLSPFLAPCRTLYFNFEFLRAQQMPVSWQIRLFNKFSILQYFWLYQPRKASLKEIKLCWIVTKILDDIAPESFYRTMDRAVDVLEEGNVLKKCAPGMMQEQRVQVPYGPR